MKKKWWQEAVVYQIYCKSFCDSDGDGVGDIRGIISKLPNLKELGINCIWLNPVYASPQVDNGYDISDYYDIEPTYGTMADFSTRSKPFLRTAPARSAIAVAKYKSQFIDLSIDKSAKR